MATALLGQIREVRTHISASGDKSGRVQIVFNTAGQDDVVDQLNRMQDPQSGVYVVFFDEVEYAEIEKKKSVTAEYLFGPKKEK